MHIGGKFSSFPLMHIFIYTLFTHQQKKTDLFSLFLHHLGNRNVIILFAFCVALVALLVLTVILKLKQVK